MKAGVRSRMNRTLASRVAPARPDRFRCCDVTLGSNICNPKKIKKVTDISKSKPLDILLCPSGSAIEIFKNFIPQKEFAGYPAVEAGNCFVTECRPCHPPISISTEARNLKLFVSSRIAFPPHCQTFWELSEIY